jgi:hypothetical protein
MKIFLILFLVLFINSFEYGKPIFKNLKKNENLNFFIRNLTLKENDFLLISASPINGKINLSCKINNNNETINGIYGHEIIYLDNNVILNDTNISINIFSITNSIFNFFIYFYPCNFNFNLKFKRYRKYYLGKWY